MIINMPVRFEGTREEIAAHEATHSFWSADPEEVPRCLDCDCRWGGRIASWPCGTRVPRTVTER